jgi:hypothetical protein
VLPHLPDAVVVETQLSRVTSCPPISVPGSTDVSCGMAAGHPFIWHDGMTFGYSALNGLFLDDGFSITILTNLALPGEAMESFAVELIHAICSTPATASDC